MFEIDITGIGAKLISLEKNMMKLSDRNTIILLMLLQLAVCLPFINSFPIALDEPFSIFWAQQDLGEMIKEINQGNNSPLHFIILNFWIKIFGISPLAVRSLSLLFSLLTVPIIYNLSRRVMSLEFAVFAVLVFVFSRFNHYHSMEARMYSLLVLENAALLLITYDIIFNNKFRYFYFVLISLSLLYTHYLGIIILGSCLLIILVYFKELRKDILFRILISVIVISVGFIPGILVMYQRISEGANSTWVPEAQWTELYGNVIRFFNNTLSFISTCLILITLFFWNYRNNIKLLFKKISEKKHLFFVLAFLIPYMGMFLYSKLISPIFLDRYLLFTTVPLYLIFAWLFSLNFIRRPNYIGMAAVLLLMIFSVKFSPDNNREPDQMAIEAEKYRRKKTLFCVIPPYFDFTFYYHFSNDNFGKMKTDKKEMINENVFGIYNLSDVNQKLIDAENIVLIDDNSKSVLPESKIYEELSSWGTVEGERVFKGQGKVTSFVRN